MMRSEFENETLDDAEIERRCAESEVMVEAFEKEEALKPKLLFKYKTVFNCKERKRICDILTNHRIYWPKYSELNDPLEGACSILTNDSVYSERDAERAKYRVLSFSEDFLLSTLWAHYAGNYSGICLAFKRGDTFSNVEKVEYVPQTHPTWSTDVGLLVEGDFLKKGNEWNYEKEWRLINAVGERFLEFRQNELACVFLGEKMRPFIQKAIRKHIPDGVKVFTIHPDDRQFRLYAKDVDSDKRIYTIDELCKHLKINP